MTHRSSPPAIAVIGLACPYPDANHAPATVGKYPGTAAAVPAVSRIVGCRSPTITMRTNKRRTKPMLARRPSSTGSTSTGPQGESRFLPYSTTDIVHWLASGNQLWRRLPMPVTPMETLPGQAAPASSSATRLPASRPAPTPCDLRWPFVRRGCCGLPPGPRESMMPELIPRLSRTLKDALHRRLPACADEDTLAGGLSNTIAGRICNHLDLMGGRFHYRRGMRLVAAGRGPRRVAHPLIMNWTWLSWVAWTSAWTRSN
jgi:hypothetical protein